MMPKSQDNYREFRNTLGRFTDDSIIEADLRASLGSLYSSLGSFDAFVETYEGKYERAVNCLKKDRDALLAFYDFPAQHWMRVRTTNPIESMFATVRLRHRRTKGLGSRKACLAMVFKLMDCASKRWRALHGTALITDVIAGVRFVDGEKKNAA